MTDAETYKVFVSFYNDEDPTVYEHIVSTSCYESVFRMDTKDGSHILLPWSRIVAIEVKPT